MEVDELKIQWWDGGRSRRGVSLWLTEAGKDMQRVQCLGWVGVGVGVNDSRSERHSVNRWWSGGDCAVSAYSENFEVWGEVRLGRRGFGANTYTAVVGVDCVVRACVRRAGPGGLTLVGDGGAAASGGHWRKRVGGPDGFMDLRCAVRGKVGGGQGQVFIRQREKAAGLVSARVASARQTRKHAASSSAIRPRPSAICLPVACHLPSGPFAPSPFTLHPANTIPQTAAA
jgi:hypothetical protein